MQRKLARGGALIAAVLSISLLAGPAASAASVSTDSAVSQSSQMRPKGTIGDGVWSPSHDESIAIIPVCQGPLAFIGWLNENFTDHGNDIAKFLRDNTAELIRLATTSPDPMAALKLALKPFLEIPIYAINDTKFHVPATLNDILHFCQSARS